MCQGGSSPFDSLIPFAPFVIFAVQFISRGRQRHADGRILARDALDLQIALVQVGQFAHDSQAQAGLSPLTAFEIGLRRRVDVGNLSGCHSPAHVHDGQHESAIVRPGFEHYRRARQRELESTTILQYDEKFQIFLALALILIVTEEFISERKKV